jgi:tetratricopeptide (TPR) repeat protein
LAPAAKNLTPRPVEDKAKGVLKETILFVSRPSIRPLLRQELKNAGILITHNVDSVEAALQHLVRYPGALLVIDWEHGPEIVNQTLKAAQGSFNIDTRPIFLIASEVSLKVVATGAEYYVSRVHAGEISRSAIQEHLDFIVEQESAELGLRASLTRVADFRMRGDWQGAGALLADAQKTFPDNLRVVCELVENLIHEERWEEASAAISQSAVSNAQDLRVQHLRSRCLMKQGNFDEAARILAECRLVNPYNVDRLVDLGQALLQTNRLKEALATFDEALALAPENQEAMKGKAQGKLLEGDVNAALTLIKSLSGPRELASIFNGAAILSIRQGRFDQGFNLYRTALSAVGANHRVSARLLFNLGIAYHKQGRLENALDCFERAFAMDRLFDKARHNALAVAGRLGRRADLGAAQGGATPAAAPASKIDEHFADMIDEEAVSRR